jgi:YD repeat-containing protein
VDPAGLRLTTAYEYDASGNVVRKMDAVGAVTRYTYDAAGRQILSVDALGAITETKYDAAGRVVQTTQYANALPTGGAMQIWRRAGTNSSADRGLGVFKAGDVVTATVRFKAPSNTSGMVFLGDVGPPFPPPSNWPTGSPPWPTPPPTAAPSTPTTLPAACCKAPTARATPSSSAATPGAARRASPTRTAPSSTMSTTPWAACWPNGRRPCR